MKEKIEQIVFLVIAILGILVAIADFLGFNVFPWLSIPAFTLLMLGTITVYLIMERRSKLDNIHEILTSIHSQYSQINLFFRALGEKDHFFEIALLYGLRGFARIVSEKRVVVDKRYANDFWLDCIRGCKRWFALSYTAPEESWDMSLGENLALAIQQERISSGAEIRRVFIVDNAEEYEHLKGIMKKQESIGVHVRWLMRNDIPKQITLQDNLRTLVTLDTTLVDDSWVWREYLDGKRRSTGCEATRDRELVDTARMVLKEIFDKAKLP